MGIRGAYGSACLYLWCVFVCPFVWWGFVTVSVILIWKRGHVTAVKTRIIVTRSGILIPGEMIIRQWNGYLECDCGLVILMLGRNCWAKGVWLICLTWMTVSIILIQLEMFTGNYELTQLMVLRNPKQMTANIQMSKTYHRLKLNGFMSYTITLMLHLWKTNLEQKSTPFIVFM